MYVGFWTFSLDCFLIFCACKHLHFALYLWPLMLFHYRLRNHVRMYSAHCWIFFWKKWLNQGLLWIMYVNILADRSQTNGSVKAFLCHFYLLMLLCKLCERSNLMYSMISHPDPWMKTENVTLDHPCASISPVPFCTYSPVSKSVSRDAFFSFKFFLSSSSQEIAYY